MSIGSVEPTQNSCMHLPSYRTPATSKQVPIYFGSELDNFRTTQHFDAFVDAIEALHGLEGLFLELIRTHLGRLI